MKKRILSLILALAMLCTLLPQAALTASAEVYSGSCGAEGDGSNLTWSFDPDTGLLTITGSGAMADYTEFRSAPWHSLCYCIEEISLPEGITNIGDWAFDECKSLTSVTIPDNVVKIGNYAFYYAWNLTSLPIGKNVKMIGDGAFALCSGLTHITIGNSVETIGDNAFGLCESLSDVVIEDSVINIGDYAFHECKELHSLTIGNGVQRIGSHAFDFCIALKGVILGNSVSVIDEEAFLSCPQMKSITIPNSVISIGSRAFGFWYAGSNVYTNIDDFIIYGFPGTIAETYATENGFQFIAADRFADVSSSDYFFNPVMWAISREPAITSGVDETHFGPNNDCTREQIVTFLWAANGKPEPEGTGSEFSDVPADAWYYQPVMWAVENKITSGMGDGSFGVGQPCTRAQAMTFLWASKGKPAPASMESTFSDVSSGDWFCKAILWAAENGVTAGIGNGLFGVNNTCTRAQIITFLYKAYN